MVINVALVKKTARKAVKLVKFPITYLIGYLELKELTAKKRKDEIYLILTPPIGDVVYGLSSYDAYQAKNTDKKLVVIGSAKSGELLQSYPQVENVILLPPEGKQYKRILNFVKSPALCTRGGGVKEFYIHFPKLKQRCLETRILYGSSG